MNIVDKLLKENNLYKNFCETQDIIRPTKSNSFLRNGENQEKIIYNLNTTEIYIGENLKIITVNFKSLRTHIEKTHHMWTVSYLLKRIAVVPL